MQERPPPTAILVESGFLLFALLLGAWSVFDALSPGPASAEAPAEPLDPGAVDALVERLEQHCRQKQPSRRAAGAPSPVFSVLPPWRPAAPPALAYEWGSAPPPPAPLFLPSPWQEARAAQTPVEDPYPYTRLAVPQELRVRTRPERILITCRDGYGTSAPAPGTLQVSLWRQRLGLARDGLDDESMQPYTAYPQDDLDVDYNEPEEEVVEEAGDFGFADLLSPGTAPEEPARRRRDGPEPNLTALADWQAQLEAREAQAKEEAQRLCRAAGPANGAWELVTPAMRVVTDLDPQAALAGTPLPAPDTAAEPGERTYAWVDRLEAPHIAAVYRYRVAASARVLVPDAETRSAPEHRDWVPRADLVGVGTPCLAVLERDFKAFLQREAGTGAPSGDTPPGQPPLVPVTKDPVTGHEAHLWDARGQKPTPRGAAYRAERCFSALRYSGPVLKLASHRVELSTIGTQPAPMAMFKVGLVGPYGAVKTKTFTLNPKPLKKPVRWSDFLKRGAKGKPVWPPVELDLAAVYEPRIRDMILPEIGSVTQLGAERYDLRSGWALVDIRPYRQTRRQYERRGKEWNLLNTTHKTGWCAVLREARPRPGAPPLYRRLRRQEEGARETATMKVEFSYDMEPELHEQIEKRRRALENEAAEESGTGR